jgi:hypothetical protein
MIIYRLHQLESTKPELPMLEQAELLLPKVEQDVLGVVSRLDLLTLQIYRIWRTRNFIE